MLCSIDLLLCIVCIRLNIIILKDKRNILIILMFYNNISKEGKRFHLFTYLKGNPTNFVDSTTFTKYHFCNNFKQIR